MGDEQTVLLTIASFVDHGITGSLDDGDEPIEPIDFLCMGSDERWRADNIAYLEADDIGVR